MSWTMAECHHQLGHRHNRLPSSSVSLNNKGQDIPRVFKLPSFTYTNSKKLRGTLIKIPLLFFLSPHKLCQVQGDLCSTISRRCSQPSLCSSSPFITMVETGRQAGCWASLALKAGCCYKPVFLSWCHEPNPGQWGRSTTARSWAWALW